MKKLNIKSMSLESLSNKINGFTNKELGNAFNYVYCSVYYVSMYSPRDVQFDIDMYLYEEIFHCVSSDMSEFFMKNGKGKHKDKKNRFFRNKLKKEIRYFLSALGVGEEMSEPEDYKVIENTTEIDTSDFPF